MTAATLFDPITLPGGLRLPNRLLLPAMHVNLSFDGTVNDTMRAFYGLRARGGAGTIIIGGCPVNKDAGGEFMIGINDDKYVPGLTTLTKAMKDGGAVTAVQLYHAGRYAHRFFLGGKAAPSASETFSPLTREKSRALTVEEIEETLHAFTVCSLRAKAAGFDAVEMLASAGYLISQFLSPLTNLRTDAYGGSLENRMRFGVEVLAAMKQAGLPVIVRFGGYDFVRGSTPQKDILTFARTLADHGAELFNVTGGWHETKAPQITYHLPDRGMAHLAALVKQAVGGKAAVSASNRLHKPEDARRMLRHGLADLVSLGRPLITDPFWPAKVREGREDLILPCISCNQACLDHVFEMKKVGCAVNPLAGEVDEAEFCQGRTANPRKVMVAGAGPAGLTAARLLAARGHEVTLYEKDPQIGGQIRVCAKSPHKEPFGRMLPAMLAQAKDKGARFVNAEVTADLVQAQQPDVVVLASGATPVVPPIPGADLPHVHTSHQFIDGDLPAGPRVVVIGGGPSGLEAALKAAMRGTVEPEALHYLSFFEAYGQDELYQLLTRGINQVTVVDMLPKVGGGVGRSTKWVYLEMLAKYGIQTVTSATVKEITPQAVTVEKDGNVQSIPADTVIMAVGVRPFAPLKDALESMENGPLVRLIGDAGKVGDVETATSSALKLARELG